LERSGRPTIPQNRQGSVMSSVKNILAQRTSRAEEYQKMMREFERQHRRSRYFMLLLMSINVLLMIMALYFVWHGKVASENESPVFKRVSVVMAVSVSVFALTSVYINAIRNLYQKRIRVRVGRDDLDVEVGERTKDIRRKLSEALDRGSE
jgi:flagellar basal body-associated protein FliL